MLNTALKVDNVKVLNDSIEFLLEAHIDRFSEIITGTFIKSWSRDDGEEKEGEKEAFELSYHSVNDSIEEFDIFAADLKAKCDFDEGGEESFDCAINKILKVICDQANGNLNDDPILAQCRQLSDFPDTDLQEAAGAYLKEGFNAYLAEKYPDLYSEMSNHESPELQVNDDTSISSQKRKLDSQELEIDFPSSSIKSPKHFKLTDFNRSESSSPSGVEMG